MSAFKSLKVNISIEYKMKALREVKTIINWQINRDLTIKTIKVSQSAYIRDLLKEENLTNYNTLTIPIKTDSIIEMIRPDNNKEADLREYQSLIGKLIYLAYGTRLDIAFTMGRLRKYNADPRKGHL